MARDDFVALVVGPGAAAPSQGGWRRWQAARLCAWLRRMGGETLALDDDPCTLMDIGASGNDLYIEPPLTEVVEAIVESRGATSIWYGAGGGRAGALAARLSADGAHQRLGVTTPEWDDRVWWTCGDRSLLREALESARIENPRFYAVKHMREGQAAVDHLGYPVVVRPHFSIGARGAGIAYNREDYLGLLEEAIHESLTGEVMVEECLEGWTKYIVVALRDARGGSRVVGILEQLSPLQRHEGNAVLITPPICAWGEAAYALEEMARRVAEVIGLTGVFEIKLAVSSHWEAMQVIDVNPVAGDALVLLEVLTGNDLVRARALMAMGHDIDEALGKHHRGRDGRCLIALPEMNDIREGDGEGHIPLERRSPAWRVLLSSNPARAAAQALHHLEVSEGKGYAHPIDRCAQERLVGIAARKECTDKEAGKPRPAHLSYLCITRAADGGMEEGLMFLGGRAVGDGAQERQAACMRALLAAGEKGIKTALYTPDAGMALLATSVADAVFLGGLEPAAVKEAAKEVGIKRVTAHFGGREAADCAAGVGRSPLRVLGMEDVMDMARPQLVLEKLRSSGVPVTVFNAGRCDTRGDLDGLTFPLHAMSTDNGHRGREEVVYSHGEARDLESELGGSVLWRPLNEEAHELHVEAVGGAQGCVVALLWEQLEYAGVSTSEGIAVFPPVSLTSEQKRRAEELARTAVEALGWHGNLSLRLVVDEKGLRVWGAEPLASGNLAFMERASDMQLACLGLMALLGEACEGEEGTATRVTVRFPLPTNGGLSDTDILPFTMRRSAGAVMGTGREFGTALSKALLSLGMRPRPGGAALLSVANREKRKAVLLARELMEIGYRIMATRGTAHTLSAAGIEVETVNKLREGRPNILDHIRNGEVSLVVNIPRGKHPHCDGFYIRDASVRHGVPCVTDMEAAMALVMGLRKASTLAPEPRALSEYAPAIGRTGGR